MSTLLAHMGNWFTMLAGWLSKVASLRPVKLDKAWLAFVIILTAVAFFASHEFVLILEDTFSSLLSTAPYILFAILLIAYLKASGADLVLGEVFKGKEIRMIVFASLLGGLAPFCSCEVIPFIAGLLAMGTPLSAIMAFWLSSPLIDPPSLMITAGELSWHFALSKAALAVAIGLFGGFTIKFALKAPLLAPVLQNPLKEQQASSSCCSSSCGTKADGKPFWPIWQEGTRLTVFRIEAIANGLFLFKWLALAYLIESLMIRYLPAETIAAVIGGEGVMPIIISALVGAPAYLNSYVAPPLVAGLMQQGMSEGAAMAFMMSGAMSCIPAMTAVYALVRTPVFAAYVALAFIGSVLAGLIYAGIV